ncbi:DUF624 domain-containing protein [Humibacter sp.]|uniref:DUF624 domain-containing protein n=1 Tax=Humibacter sp. TaxID=1940291 RepID=UPI003F7F8DEF
MTTRDPGATRDVFARPWFRWMLAAYGLLGTTAAFLIATAPFIAAVFLAPMIAIGGPVLVAVCGFSIGPAWVAALYTMRAYAAERDIEPFRLFLRGYRLGWRQTLLFWAPYFALLVVLALDLTSSAGLPAPVYWLLVALGAGALLWGSTVLVIVAFFSFRLRDAMRLAAYGLAHTPRWLLGAVLLLLGAGALVYVGSEAAAGILVAPFALLTVIASRPLVRRLTEEFTS